MLSDWHQRWVRRLDALPARLSEVFLWRGWREPDGQGELHPVPTLVVAVEGCVRVRRGKQRLTLTPGQALIIAPGVWHQHLPLEGASAAWQQGLLPACSDIVYSDAQESRWGGIAREPAGSLIALLLKTASQSHATTQTGSIDQKRCHQILADLLHSNLQHEAVDPTAEHPAVQEMLHAVWGGLHQGITAADMVAASGMSRARAYALFTAATGLSPHQTLLQARTALAEGLVESGLSVAAAATCAGFNNRQAFTRQRNQRS